MTDVPSGPDKPDKPPRPPNPSQYTQLELAIYVVYTVGLLSPPVTGIRGVQYVKDVRYIFSPEEALAKLEEMDHGRPVWKVHGKPPKPEPTPVRLPALLT